MNNYQKLDSSDTKVSKYIFNFHDALTEGVLYRYPNFETRTVLCISVQSGCPVGCVFCGTGKHFVRNLTDDEIVQQVAVVFKDQNIENINSYCQKLQIMFMSMGEPFLNWDNSSNAIKKLNELYPNADLLISTVGINDRSVMKNVIQLSSEIDKVGLQFSIHKSLDKDRNKLIPYSNKLSLSEIRDFGIAWYHATNRKPFLNMCVGNDDNLVYYINKNPKAWDIVKTGYGFQELNRFCDLFSPEVFCVTISVICQKDETMAKVYQHNIDVLHKLSQKFLEMGYNSRVFNPAGQDDIGGGCGQLIHFQKWFKEQTI